MLNDFTAKLPAINKFMTLGLSHHDVSNKINKKKTLPLPSVSSKIYTRITYVSNCSELLWTYDVFSGPSPNCGT